MSQVVKETQVLDFQFISTSIIRYSGNAKATENIHYTRVNPGGGCVQYRNSFMDYIFYYFGRQNAYNFIYCSVK